MTQQRVSPIALTSQLPAVPTLSLQGAVGQSANLVEVKNSTGTILSRVDLSGNFTAVGITASAASTVTGTLTANSFIPTSSTVPTNGVYLPAANTVGIASNSILRMQIDANGSVGIGTNPSASINFILGRNVTGATDSRVLQIASVVQSDVTGSARIFFSAPATQAASFTVGTLSHFQAAGATVGAGSTIGTQNGFLVSAAVMSAGVTNAYGFRGLIAAASGAWNAYMDGTAANYFAGQTTVGSTSLTLGGGSVAQQFGAVSGAATTVGAVIRGASGQSANLTEWQNNSPAILTAITSAGTINFASGNTSATATAGATTAPALVQGFITMQVAGTTVKVPYYAN